MRKNYSKLVVEQLEDRLSTSKVLGFLEIDSLLEPSPFGDPSSFQNQVV